MWALVLHCHDIICIGSSVSWVTCRLIYKAASLLFSDLIYLMVVNWLLMVADWLGSVMLTELVPTGQLSLLSMLQ